MFYTLVIKVPNDKMHLVSTRPHVLTVATRIYIPKSGDHISEQRHRLSKIEKVPRGIRGEKSSKDMASSRNLVSTIGALASPKWGTEPGVRKGKRSLLASHTRCICSMETTHNSVKVKLGIKVMKLVESLIGREVTVGLGSECHLTFVRGLFHIAQQDPRIDHKTS